MPALVLVLVEIPRISGPAQMRHNRPLHLAAVHFVPVNVFEPLVRLDPRRPAGNVAEPLGHVDGAESGDQVARWGRHGAGEAHFAFYDSVRPRLVGGTARNNIGGRGKGTVRRFSWGSGPRREVGQQETRRRGFRMPTSLLLCRGLTMC